MVDIAETAGVSRQTLYALFGTKDDLVAATITYIADKNFADVEEGLETCESLEDQLDTYFSKTIVSSFALIENSEDPEDIMSGHSQAGREALDAVKARHTKLVAKLLTPYKDQIDASDHSVSSLAHFCVTCARGFKYSAKSKNELNTLLSVLKTSVLLIAKPSRNNRANAA